MERKENKNTFIPYPAFFFPPGPFLLWALLCFYETDIGDFLRSRGHSFWWLSYNKHCISLLKAGEGTWESRILTLHLNYVAGYTGPLLFLFERTPQLLRCDTSLQPKSTRGKTVTFFLVGNDPMQVSCSNLVISTRQKRKSTKLKLTCG